MALGLKGAGFAEVPATSAASSGLFQATHAEKAMSHGVNVALTPSKVEHLGPLENSSVEGVACAVPMMTKKRSTRECEWVDI